MPVVCMLLLSSRACQWQWQLSRSSLTTMTATLSLSGWADRPPPLALWRRGAHCVDHSVTTGSGILKPGTGQWQGGLQMPLAILRARRVQCGTPAGITSRRSFTGNWNADATRTWRQASSRFASQADSESVARTPPTRMRTSDS
jgi:hypothetical protein